MTSLASEARRFLRGTRSGVLSTHSARFEGYPFGSIAPFVLDHAGNPLILISTIAEHTKNIRKDPRVSLIAFDPAAPDMQALGKKPALLERVTGGGPRRLGRHLGPVGRVGAVGVDDGLVLGQGQQPLVAPLLCKQRVEALTALERELAHRLRSGKLKIDDKVIDHMPWFRMYDPWVTREMTVRDLLVHRSGLGLDHAAVVGDG